MKTIATTLIALALVAAGGPALAAGSGDGYRAVLEPYEAVRQALVADDLEAARQGAGSLQDEVGHLRHHLTPAAAGVPAEGLDAVEALLPEIEQAAGELTGAGDLEAARDAFYALSKPLVRWRQAAGVGPAVLYCSMKKRSWLQPGGETTGNPYYGQEMPSCGELVSR
jgi:hypothetical protein